MASSGVDERVIGARGSSRLTIGLRGDFRGEAVGTLREVAAAAIDADKDVVVDMIEVTAIGAEGLAALDAVGDLARTRSGDGSLFVRPPVANRDLYDAVLAVAGSSFEIATRDDPPAPADQRRSKRGRQ